MIDIQKLEQRCNEPKLVGGYAYIDNGSDVLAVAHTDTVQQGKKFIHGQGIVCSPRLDDRLGVHIILDVLPALGINVDVLLTTDEEMGASTASTFVPTKKYNWIVEFDRESTDVVTYQFYSEEFEELLFNYGFLEGYGSYSDIANLEHLGVKAFNLGVGVYCSHQEQAYAVIAETEATLLKFVKFYNEMKDVRLEHTFNQYAQYYDPYSLYDYHAQYGYEDDCWYCGFPLGGKTYEDDEGFSFCDVKCSERMKGEEREAYHKYDVRQDEMWDNPVFEIWHDD